jgi:hypothetical protein
MADSTVNQTVRRFGHDDAVAALEHVARATAILRVLTIAVAAQKDRAAVFEDNRVARWSPAVVQAIASVKAVREPLDEMACSPNGDWCTPLTILEALDAALWQTGIGEAKDLTFDEFRQSVQAAIDGLERLQRDIAQGAEDLAPVEEV